MTSMRRRRRINFQLIYVVASECGPILSLSLSLRPLSVRSSVRVSARPCMIAHTLVRPSVRPPARALRQHSTFEEESCRRSPLYSSSSSFSSIRPRPISRGCRRRRRRRRRRTLTLRERTNERTDSQWLVADSSPAGRGRGQAQVQIGQTWQAGSGVVVAAAARERGPSAVATATGEER